MVMLYFFVQLGFIFGHNYSADCGTVSWLELSRLMGSLVALTFNGVTDKKSSSILIYKNKGMDIYTGNGGVIKNKMK